MRILALDIGTGTQDILLFDSSRNIENCPKLVMPSATSIIAGRVEAATARRDAIVLSGVVMGGGPCSWAVERHLKAGLPVYATPEAARTFDDHLENVERMGVTVVGEDEAQNLVGEGVTRIEMKDLDLAAVGRALEAFGVEPRYDGVAVAVFDHGAAPLDVSDRTFRFDHLRRTVQHDNTLYAFGFFPDEAPASMTRMQAVAATYSLDAPLLLLDTAPAGAIGAQDDPAVRAHPERVVVNLGNMHATGFHLVGDHIQGLFEHHTGLIDRPKLEGIVQRLVDGSLTNEEIFADHGHGAHILRHPSADRPFLAVTGPQRRMLVDSPLRPHFAAPHGDMMLTGCFGLVRCFGRKLSNWREEIEAALNG
ncbi:MAG: pyruvate formate lyase-activating protein [Chloroflexi bacterium]|nr:pyruvate formate lyase-activating protein [Chloroflexota bacterium]